MANITQKCRCHHQKEGHMLIQPSVLEIRSYYVILGGEHSRIVLYGYIWSRVPCSHPPMGWGGYDAPVVVYIHTYIPTYLPTYIPTYIHTYIPLHYLTLHYLTLHYLTLHSIHTYIIHTYILTYIYRHTHIHTYIPAYIPTYQHTTTTGHRGGDQQNHTTTTGHRGGWGTEEPYHHHRPQGGDQKNQTILSTHTHWWGGGGGVANAAPYIYIWMCLKMGGTHRCPFNYIIGENDEYGMQWDTHPQKLGCQHQADGLATTSIGNYDS